MAGPLIVTATLGQSDFARLDALRRAHFPPERNQLAAHLTMFHALPPSVEDEARSVLSRLTRQAPPEARIVSIMDLGGGVAFKVESNGLSAMRDEIAEQFHGCLTAQDSAGWRPHITVQNKVARATAVALRQALESEFRPQPLIIRGLALHRYVGGPWDPLDAWTFRG